MHGTQENRQRILTAVIAALAILGLWATLGLAEDSAERDSVRELYERATKQLDREHYKQAADLYAEITRQHAAHALAKDALYWEAFSRYRVGKSQELLRAAQLLERLENEFPRAEMIVDAEQLAVRIQGQLAERGNAEAAERVLILARELEERAEQLEEVYEEEESGADQVQIAALNALLHVNPERAQPILHKVLKRRDDGSTELRSQALFILSQGESEENQDLLIHVLREDPEPELRQQAMFWLGQIPNEKTLVVIEDVLKSSDDPEMQEQALYALSQHEGAHAKVLFREIALDRDADPELRSQSIFWLGQRAGAEDLDFLQNLYEDLDDMESKEQVLFSASQIGGEASHRWLMSLAMNAGEEMELRTRALFWAGQMGGIDAGELYALYRQAEDAEMREQVVFVLSQQEGSEAVDALMRIAREEEDPELKAQLIFWLGQTNDARVVDFLEEIIDR